MTYPNIIENTAFLKDEYYYYVGLEINFDFQNVPFLNYVGLVLVELFSLVYKLVENREDKDYYEVEVEPKCT